MSFTDISSLIGLLIPVAIVAYKIGYEQGQNHKIA